MRDHDDYSSDDLSRDGLGRDGLGEDGLGRDGLGGDGLGGDGLGSDDEPELAGYQPHDRPLRSPHLITVMRVVVVIGLVGLILPGLLVTAVTANRTALTTCATYTAYYAPEAVDFSTRFELISPAGMGWNCYAIAFGGEEVLVASLGLIPGGARLPAGPVVES